MTGLNFETLANFLKHYAVRHHCIDRHRDSDGLRRSASDSFPALALVLLVGAGLLLQSFQELMETDPGFPTEQTLALTVSLPSAGYSDPQRVRQLYPDLLQRFRALPGVTQVGSSTDLPFKITETRAFIREGQDPSVQGTAPSVVHAWVLGDSDQLAAAVRSELRSVDPQLAIQDIRSLEQDI